MSEKTESEIESQKDFENENNIKDDLIVKKTESITYEEIKSEEGGEATNQDDFELISIKNEVIDSEYDVQINENVNSKNQKDVVDNHHNLNESEKQMNKQNDEPKTEDSVVINTRKRRLLQGMQSTCEQIGSKRKSETVLVQNESLTNNESPPSPSPPLPTKEKSQKYEIFKPTIKMSKKETSTSNASNSLISNQQQQPLIIQADSSDEILNNERKTNNNNQECENMFELNKSIKTDPLESVKNESDDYQSKNEKGSLIKENSKFKCLFFQLENNKIVEEETCSDKEISNSQSSKYAFHLIGKAKLKSNGLILLLFLSLRNKFTRRR